jgi:hypothetical protein
MDSSRRTGVRGIANDTGTGTKNGEKGGIEGPKEEAEMSGKNTVESLKEEARSEVEDLRTVEGMKATRADKD